MTRSVSTSVELSADPTTAYAALTGPGWPVALDARLRDGSRLAEATDLPDGGRRQVLTRRLPENVPSFLARFLPADGLVRQTDVWGPERDGVRHGTWEVVSGAPGTVRGTQRLEATAGGSRWVVEGTVTVSVPLVGGRAEGFLAPLLDKLVATQGEVLRALVRPDG